MHKEKIKPTHLHMYEQQIIIIFYPYIIPCFYFVPNRDFSISFSMSNYAEDLAIYVVFFTTSSMG